MAQGIPFLKLSGLLVKALAKPMANRVKASAAEHPLLSRVCVGIGQTTNSVVNRLTYLTSEVRGHKYRSKQLKKSEALKNGAEILSETIVVGATLAVAVFEFERAQRKKHRDDEKQRQKQAEMDDIQDARLAKQDAQIAIVEAMVLENRRLLLDLTDAMLQGGPSPR